jgi:indole-3-glycerol phosphate synthase
VEVHNQPELDRALALGADMIGINNRNLQTFDTTLETTERLAPRVPKGQSKGHVVVSESGIFTPADIERMNAVGVSAFLVGESLMRQPDVTLATRTLLAPIKPKKTKSA